MIEGGKYLKVLTRGQNRRDIRKNQLRVSLLAWKALESCMLCLKGNLQSTGSELHTKPNTSIKNSIKNT